MLAIACFGYNVPGGTYSYDVDELYTLIGYDLSKYNFYSWNTLPGHREGMSGSISAIIIGY